MTKLKQQLIRLGKQFPQLRDDIRPVLQRIDGRSPQPQPQKPPMGYGGGYGAGRQRYASRNKQARRNLFKELVDYEEIVSLMRDTEDQGVKKALRSIIQEFHEILTLDDNEEMALNRLENLVSRGPNDQNDLRNQVMKIANHLGLDLGGLQFFASQTKVSVNLGELAHEVGFDFKLADKVSSHEVQQALEAHPKVAFDGQRSGVDFHQGRYYVNAEIMLEGGMEPKDQQNKINVLLGQAIDNGLPGNLSRDLNVEESWIIPDKAPHLTVVFTFSVMGSATEDVISDVETLSGTLGGSRLDLQHFDASFWKKEHEQPVFEADARVKVHPYYFEHGRLSPDKLRDFIEDTLFDNVASLVSGARGAAVHEISSIQKD